MTPAAPRSETSEPAANTTIIHAHVVDTPENPFEGGRLRAEHCALAVREGVIVFRGTPGQARQRFPDAHVKAVAGLLLPGLIDTHVHYPQLRIVGGLGMPLLDWLDRCALPEEARMSDPAYAAAVAEEFVTGLISAGTTTALVFGAHDAAATDTLFRTAAAHEYRMTAGLVLGDINLRPDLHTTPERARQEMAELIGRWHDHGRLQYAVTPRFALSCTPEMLQACQDAMADAPGVLMTSHVNENLAETEAVAGLFPEARDYSDVYDRFGLLGEASVLAHNVHAGPGELQRLAGTGTSVAHCPSSNSSLGSGLFPMRAHVRAGVPVALGSDVGGGTGLSLFKEGLQAYFHQQLHPDGLPLQSAHLLYLATAAGAKVLNRAEVGHLSVGMEFDAISIDPPQSSPLAAALRHSDEADDALAAVFAGGTSADIGTVWMRGRPVAGIDRQATVDPAAIG